MGPTSSIILNRKIEFEEIYQVDEFLNSISKGKINGGKTVREFWVDAQKFLKLNKVGSDCQFTIHFDNKLRDMDEDEILEIEILTSQIIKSKITISAGCNQQGDHNVLGELTLGIAKILNGLVDYGASLDVYQQGIKNELKGKVYTIAFNNGISEYHVSNTEFLTNWIKHPKFRMVK